VHYGYSFQKVIIKQSNVWSVGNTALSWAVTNGVSYEL